MCSHQTIFFRSSPTDSKEIHLVVLFRFFFESYGVFPNQPTGVAETISVAIWKTYFMLFTFFLLLNKILQIKLWVRIKQEPNRNLTGT